MEIGKILQEKPILVSVFPNVMLYKSVILQIYLWKQQVRKNGCIYNMFLASCTYNIFKEYGGLQLISYVFYSLYEASKEVRQPSKVVVFMI